MAFKSFGGKFNRKWGKNRFLCLVRKFNICGCQRASGLSTEGKLQMVKNDIKKNYSELQIREILTLTWGRVGWMSIWRGLQKENVPLVFAAPLPVLPWILIDEFSMQWNKLFTRRRDTGNIFVFIFPLCYCCCCWKRRQLFRSVLVIVNCYVLFFLFCSLCYFYSCPFSGYSGCLPRIWSTYCFLKVLNKSPPPHRALDTGQFRFWSKFKVPCSVQKWLH